MNKTKINWTEATWNPASGCSEVSAECERCYAKVIAEKYRGKPAFPVGFDVLMRPWKLAEPKRIKRPSLIFTNSMTDMFHQDITDAYRDKIIDVMNESSHHRYQVLTKRPGRAEKFFRTRKVPASMWLGCTVGVQSTTWRIDVLRRIDAKVKFLSVEPLLTEVIADMRGVDWIIGGGESGLHLSVKRPEELDRALVRRDVAGWVPREDRYGWARRLRDQAKAAGAAFWWKQWGGPKPESGGRILDGRTWDEMPTHIAGAMPAEYTHREGMQRVLPVVQ